MFLRKRAAKNKKPKVRYSEYLSHEGEPKHFKTYEIPQDIEEALMANGFFLKKRVWRNMSKIRRSYARAGKQFEDDCRKKTFRPRRPSIYSSPGMTS